MALFTAQYTYALVVSIFNFMFIKKSMAHILSEVWTIPSEEEKSLSHWSKTICQDLKQISDGRDVF